METLCLTLDTIALMVVIFFSLKNEKLRAGIAEIGPFRIKPAAKPVQAAVQVKKRRERIL